MKRWSRNALRSWIGGIVWGVFVVVGTPIGADETAEPPLTLTLTVDGEPVSIQFDRQQVLRGTFENPTIELSAATTRHFDRAGVVFDYPAHFTWDAEANAETQYRSWVVSGNDSKIMVFAFLGAFSAKEYTAGIAEQFGLGKSKIEPIRRRLGKRQLDGLRVTVMFDDEVGFVQDCFSLPSPDGEVRFMVLQDVVPESTPDLAEPEEVLELLKRTFRVRTTPS